MFDKLEKYKKNEAPVAVYRFTDNAFMNNDTNNKIFIIDKYAKINTNVKDFFTLISKLNGNVWVIANGTDGREILESFKKSNVSFFYLIESEEVHYFSSFLSHTQPVIV